jgi:hypothetical protein
MSAQNGHGAMFGLSPLSEIRPVAPSLETSRIWSVSRVPNFDFCTIDNVRSRSNPDPSQGRRRTAGICAKQTYAMKQKASAPGRNSGS